MLYRASTGRPKSAGIFGPVPDQGVCPTSICNAPGRRAVVSRLIPSIGMNRPNLPHRARYRSRARIASSFTGSQQKLAGDARSASFKRYCYRAATLVSGEGDPVRPGRCLARIPRQYLRGIKPSAIIANWLAIKPSRGPKARSINP